MAFTSLTDITSVINQQIDTQELLSEYLCKFEAILCASSAEKILEHEESVLQNYLWVLVDLVREAKKLNDETLRALLRDSRNLGYR